MKSFFGIFYCKGFFLGLILVNLIFPCARADVDDRSNKSLEARLHNIYEQHYSREVLDADWFKVIEAVHEQTYSVKKGDTLWGISTVYFGDGNYWSKLWSVNKNITNPHLIYSGDQIQFTTGSFTQPPSISVTKNSNQLSENPTADDGTEVAAEDDTSGGEKESAGPSNKAAFNSSGGLDMPNDLPDFFKPPYNKFKKSENITSIEPRPQIIPSSEIMLTQEVVAREPEKVCTVKSVGLNRVVTGEGGIVVLECRNDKARPSIGGLLSILDGEMEEIQSGHIVKVVAVVKVRKRIGDDLFEGVVTQQYDAILNKAMVSAYVPTAVNVDPSGPVKELPVNILNANAKSIWSNGDFIFMKMKGEQANVGDVLSFSNRYDYHINSFQRTALVKVVATQAPFATGVVVDASNALREDSVSAPINSDSWFF
jgi:hypothetical protein